ncbi:MAG: septum formation initiator family protein [Novosphingobium sp.]|uniref:FtsB family cell division protein n=1 Tax=Novosphingobium sp. TaxID=1874826 RepID=UPI0032B962A5
MNSPQHPRLAKERATQALALACLLGMSSWITIGPSGILSWSENSRLLELRQKELQQIEARREVLKNRVALLNPNQVDPDMAGQLLRSDLNMVHPDEKVLLLN